MNKDGTDIMDVFNVVTDFARKFLELGESAKKANDILDGYSPKAVPTVKEPRPAAREFWMYRYNGKWECSECESLLGMAVMKYIGTDPPVGYFKVREVIENE